MSDPSKPPAPSPSDSLFDQPEVTREAGRSPSDILDIFSDIQDFIDDEIVPDFDLDEPDELPPPPPIPVITPTKDAPRASIPYIIKRDRGGKPESDEALVFDDEETQDEAAFAASAVEEEPDFEPIPDLAPELVSELVSELAEGLAGLPSRPAPTAEVEIGEADTLAPPMGGLAATYTQAEAWSLKASRTPEPEPSAGYELKPLASDDPNAPVGIYGERTLPEILSRAFQDIFTGRLLLEREGERKIIFLAHGRPIGSRSNIPSEALGHLLYREGRITEDQHRRSVAMMKEEGIKQGEALIKLKALHPDDLPLYLRKQTQQRLLNCFAWRHAHYGLSYEADVAQQRKSAHELNPLLVIFEGIQRRTPIDLLLKHFDGYNRRPVRVTQRLQDYSTLLKPFQDELRVAALCDGTRTLGEILSESGYGISDNLRILRALEILECVTFEAPKKPSARFQQRRSNTRSLRADKPPSPRASGEGPYGGLQARLNEGSIYKFLGFNPQMGQEALTRRLAELKGKVEQELKVDEALFIAAEPVLKRIQLAEEILLDAAKRASYHKLQGLPPLQQQRRVEPLTPHAPSASYDGPAPTPRRLPKHPPSLPRQSSGAYPAASTGGFPVQRSGAYAAVGTGGYPVHPSGAYPSAGTGGFPIHQSGAYPSAGTGGFPIHQSGAYPAAHSGAYPAQRGPSGISRPGQGGLSDAYPSMSPAQMIQMAEQKYQEGRYLLVDNPPQALACFEMACRLDAHTPLYRMFRGWVRFTMTQPNDRQGKTGAHDEIKQALMEDNQQAIGYVLLGHIYRQTGNAEMAARLYRRAKKIDPYLEEANEALRSLGH